MGRPEQGEHARAPEKLAGGSPSVPSLPQFKPRNAFLPRLGSQAPAVADAPRRPVVLLVDDDVEVLDGLALALHKQPIEILTARSARAALDVLEFIPVDVIVSDERMPGVSGSELLKLVSSSRPKTQRILLTGHVTLETAERARKAGAFGFLTKPCDARALAAMIAQALDVRRSGAG